MRRMWLMACVGLPGVLQAGELREEPAVAALFEEAGVTGTCVVLDGAGGGLVGANGERAATPLVPASSFKIPHTLIGLSVGAVQDVDEAFPYDGSPRLFPEWEREMSLREAIAASNAAVYQQLALRIGPATMREHLDRLEYGNRDIGEAVDRFWLDGPLQISALEQVHFLARLARDELAYPPALQAAVREIVLVEEGEGWRLYAKTGWENAPRAGVGWWVGWMENAAGSHAFALNLDIREPEDAALRVSIGRACLRVLGLP